MVFSCCRKMNMRSSAAAHPWLFPLNRHSRRTAAADSCRGALAAALCLLLLLLGRRRSICRLCRRNRRRCPCRRRLLAAACQPQRQRHASGRHCRTRQRLQSVWQVGQAILRGLDCGCRNSKLGGQHNSVEVGGGGYGLLYFHQPALRQGGAADAAYEIKTDDNCMTCRVKVAN